MSLILYPNSVLNPLSKETMQSLDNPILHLVGEEADRLQLDCYVIGGWVRDLLLHRPSTDIDIVVVKKVDPLLPSVPPSTPPTKGESIQLPSNLTPSLVGRDGVGSNSSMQVFPPSVLS